MENKEEILLKKLDKYRNEGGIHASNLFRKWSEKKTNRRSVMIDIIEKYIEYRENIDKYISPVNFDEITSYLNDYKGFLRKYEYEFSAQSKLKSTVLEEFLFILFYQDELCFKLKKGAIEAYSNLYFSPKSFDEFVNKPASLYINRKNQDFTIYKEYEVVVDNEKKILKVPIISIECKTYLDKTMLEGSVSTAEKIKKGNPQAKFYIVTETYDVDYEVDIYGTQIDQIYVLRKQKREKNNSKDLKPIYADVIENLWKDIRDFLSRESWSDNKESIEKFGKIFNK